MHNIFHRFSNWRTTLLGVAAIMAALGDVFTQIAQRDWDATRFGADVTGIFTGLGLLFARDSVASAQEHHFDRVAIAENTADIANVQQDAVVAKEVAVVAKQEAAVAKREVANVKQDIQTITEAVAPIVTIPNGNRAL